MLQADRKELGAALRVVKPGISSRPGVPALTGVLMESTGDGRLSLTGTDLEVSVRAEVDANGEATRILVPFKMLEQAVKNGVGEVVTLEADEAQVRVDGAGSLRLLPVEDFPTLDGSGEYVGGLEAGALVAAIAAAEPAASGDEARPVLTGVLVELERSEPARLVATDSYRLHVVEFEASAPNAWRAIVPARALRAVAKILGRRASGRVDVVGTDGQVRFDLGGVSLTVRLIEGEFPNYRQLIPEPGAGTVVRYDLGEFAQAVAAASTYCVDTSPMRLEVGPLGIRASASSPEIGQWVGTLERVEVTGEPVTVALNPRYLMGCMQAVGDGATVEIRDGLKPAVFRSADGARTALVMPVRLPATYGPNDPRVVPGVGTDAPKEPSAAEREAGAKVEVPEPTEPEYVDTWHCPRCGNVKSTPVEGPCPSCGQDGEPWVPGVPEPGEFRETAPDPDVASEASVAPQEGPGTSPGPEVAPEAGEIREALAAGAAARADRTALVDRLRGGSEPAPNGDGDGGTAWGELATIGDVQGVRVRLVIGPDGGPWVDVRRFVESKRYSGPTRKGLAIPASAAAILAELLLDAAAAGEH